MSAEQPQNADAQLDRAIGVPGLAANIINTTIGASIFALPALVAVLMLIRRRLLAHGRALERNRQVSDSLLERTSHSERPAQAGSILFGQGVPLTDHPHPLFHPHSSVNPASPMSHGPYHRDHLVHHVVW